MFTQNGSKLAERTFEQPDPHLFRQPLSLLIHSHVETQDARQLLRLLQHRRGPHDILLVHRADINSGHRDLTNLQEVQKRLQRT